MTLELGEREHTPKDRKNYSGYTFLWVWGKFILNYAYDFEILVLMYSYNKLCFTT